MSIGPTILSVAFDVSTTIVFSQKRTISGNVVDEIKEPLIGLRFRLRNNARNGNRP